MKPASTNRLMAEHGFTLMELLVAMFSAIVVLGGILATLEFTLQQQSRVTDRVDADQIGRGAMAKIVEELRSSCTGFEAHAIQGPSETPASPLASTGPVNLWFVSAYGNSNSGNALIKEVVEHDVNWTETGKSNTGERIGTLRDYRFASTAGSATEGWTFPSLTSQEVEKAKASARILASNVIPPVVTGKTETPTIFQYYKYQNNATSLTNGELVSMSASEVPSAAKAGEIAKVAIAFTQAPSSGDTRNDRTASLSGSIVLRFTPTESESDENTPCH